MSGSQQRPRAVPAGPTLEEAVEDARYVFVGHVDAVEKDDSDEIAVVRPTEVLKGTPPSVVRVRILPREETVADAVFVVDGATPAEVLPSARLDLSERDARRVVAGVPAADPPPTEDEIRALAEESDLIVFGEAHGRTDAPREARIEVVEVLRGSAPDALEVEAGAAADAPAPWSFDDDMYGVFFLQRQGDRMVVVSPMSPAVIEPAAVRAALEAEG